MLFTHVSNFAHKNRKVTKHFRSLRQKIAPGLKQNLISVSSVHIHQGPDISAIVSFSRNDILVFGHSQNVHSVILKAVKTPFLETLQLSS